MQFLRYKAQRAESFVTLGHFLPFYLTNKLKNQTFFKIKKKTSGNIIILHLCTSNNDNKIYVYWDMETNMEI